MASSKDFSEWSREEKDAFAKKRMQEMKLKNEMLMQRHAEVLEDKHRAENENSSIKAVIKKEKSLVIEEVQNKAQSEREWDRGKADLELWNSPDYHDSQPNRKGSNWRSNRREDSWTNSTYTQSKNNQQMYDSSQANLPREFGFGTAADWGADNWRNYTQSKNNQQKYDEYGQSVFSNRTGSGNNRYKSENCGVTGSNYEKHYTRGRTWGNRGKGASYVSNEQSRSNYSRDDGKKYSNAAPSNSSFIEPDTRILDKSKSSHPGNTWSDDEFAESQQKQSRVKNWINSISSSDSWDQGNNSKNISKEKSKDIRGLPSSNQKFQNDDTWDNNHAKLTTTVTKNQFSDRGTQNSSFSHNSYKQGNNVPCDQQNYDKSDFKRQDDNRRSFEKNKYAVQSYKANTECHAQRFLAQSNVKGMHNNQKVESSFKSKYVEESDTWGDIEVDNSKSNNGWQDSAQNSSSSSWKQRQSDACVTQGSKNVNCDADVDQSTFFRNSNSGRKSVEKNSKFDSIKKEFSNSNNWKQSYRTQSKNSKTDGGFEHSTGEEYKGNQYVNHSRKNVNYAGDKWLDNNQPQTFKKTNFQQRNIERGSNSGSAENKSSNSWKKTNCAQNNNAKSDEGWLDSTKQKYQINMHETQTSKGINNQVDEWADIDQSEIFKKKSSEENDYCESDEGWLGSNEKEHTSKQSETNILKNVMHDVDGWADVDQSELKTNYSVKNNAQKGPSFDNSCCDNESTLMGGGNAKSVDSALEQTDDDDGFINDGHSKFFEGKEVNLSGNDMIHVVIHLDNPSPKVQPFNDDGNISKCNIITDSETALNPDLCFTSHNSVEEKVGSIMAEVSDSEMSSINQGINVDSKDINTDNTKTAEFQNGDHMSSVEGDFQCEELECMEGSLHNEKNILQNNEIFPQLTKNNIPDEDHNPTSNSFVADKKSVLVEKNEVSEKTLLKGEVIGPDMSTSNQSAIADHNSSTVSKSVVLDSGKSVNFSEFLPTFDAGFSVEGERGVDKSPVKQKHIQPNQSSLEKHSDVSKEENNINCSTERKESLQLNENSQTDNENASALTQSDDGGWSTVSEEADSNAESIDDQIHNTDAVKDLHE